MSARDFIYKNRFNLSVLTIACVLLYFSILLNGFVDDDTQQIVNNPHLGDFSWDFYHSNGLLYFRPLMFLSFTIISRFANLNPFWYHLPQLLLFLVTILMVYLLFSKFFSRSIALVLSLFFLVHPINVESVAYIADLQDVYYVFFGMLGIVVIEFLKPNRKWLLALSTFACVLLSCLSKGSGIIFVPILILFAWLFWRDKLKTVIIGSLLGLVSYGIALVVSPPYPNAFPIYYPLTHLSLGQRLLNIPGILWYYIHTLLLPLHLATGQQWSLHELNWTQFWGPLCAAAICILLIVLGGRYIYRNGSKNNEKFKIYAFFVVWLALSMLPILQIFPLDEIVADRWFYLPFIGLLGVVGVLASEITWGKLAPQLQKVGLAVLGVILVLLAARSYVRIQNYKSNLTLLSHDYAVNSSNYRLINELGAVYQNMGNNKKAFALYSQSLRVNSIHNIASNVFANRMGIDAVHNHDAAAAERDFRLAALPNGGLAPGYLNLIQLLLLENRPSEALKYAIQARRLFPTNSDVWQILQQAELVQAESAASKK